MPRIYRTPILCYRFDGNCLCKLVKLWTRERQSVCGMLETGVLRILSFLLTKVAV